MKDHRELFFSSSLGQFAFSSGLEFLAFITLSGLMSAYFRKLFKAVLKTEGSQSTGEVTNSHCPPA